MDKLKVSGFIEDINFIFRRLKPRQVKVEIINSDLDDNYFTWTIPYKDFEKMVNPISEDLSYLIGTLVVVTLDYTSGHSMKVVDIRTII